MRSSVVGTALLAGAAMSLLLAACSTSAESLENDTREMPGVIKVKAVENDGDDGLPFEKIPKHVSILMDADATVTQIMAVFDAYEDGIDDGDVEGIEVALDAPKHATLATGEDIHATTAMVQELVAVQHEDNIIEYRREAYPVLPSVHLVLAAGDFDDVVAVADRYRDVDVIDDVGVSCGDFALVRDEVNEDLEFTAARERFVHEVALSFRLRGALVAGRGPLRLMVAPSDEAAVRRFVESSPGARGLGRVRVSVRTPRHRS